MSCSSLRCREAGSMWWEAALGLGEYPQEWWDKELELRFRVVYLIGRQPQFDMEGSRGNVFHRNSLLLWKQMLPVFGCILP